MMPILHAFCPELLLVSAGFDAAEGDAQVKVGSSGATLPSVTLRLYLGYAWVTLRRTRR